MSITEQLHIECPPARAFDLMGDVRNLTKWNDGATRAELLTDEPIREGSTFLAVNRGQEMKSTITKFDRPRHIEFDVVSKRLDVTTKFEFSNEGAGTRLDIVMEPEPKGIMKVLLPVLKPIIRRDLRTQHLKFKAFCESESATHRH